MRAQARSPFMNNTKHVLAVFALAGTALTMVGAAHAETAAETANTRTMTAPDDGGGLLGGSGVGGAGGGGLLGGGAGGGGLLGGGILGG